MYTRRSVLLASSLASTLHAVQPIYKLIAHRGGVVDQFKPENSAAAFTAARNAGYWMTEVDIRRSRDGEPVLFHDSKLTRYHALDQRPEDLTWKELSALRPKLLHFEEACQLCAGRMRLMLDLKGSRWPQEFYLRLLRHIEDAKVPGPVYSLGGPRVLPLFEHRIMVSINPRELATQEVDPQHFFLFDIAEALGAKEIELARSRSLTPVAAINTFRYTMAKRDENSGPKEDFDKLQPLGVTHYQIDSRYEALFA